LSETLAAGRYRIERTLGSGGMAVVYLAHDEELHRQVAIKVLAEHLAGDDSFRARFLQESKLAGRLSHPNVVQVYDAGETEGSPYIVMEYVPGDTIAQRGKLWYGHAVPLALQACAGLQHAHAAGLVHRDVKPANLLVREDDVLKIADFGIARAAELTRLTQHGTVLGTAAYLSPEQAAGEEVTTATDIYSLGAVVYELLTGRSPYEFESLAELAAQQKNGVITPLRDLEPSVPEPVEAAVMHALAREPRFRPASAADFAAELAAASELPAEPLLATAKTEPLHARTYRSVPGSSAWLWIVGAAAVATVAVVLGLLSLGGGGSSTKPQPVRIQAPARGATPAAEARNLSAWLRAHSR
jgi:eukaryotic-like serine/threonine-protein kinase